MRGARRRNTRRIATTSNDASRDGSPSKSLQIFSDEPLAQSSFVVPSPTATTLGCAMPLKLVALAVV